MGISLRAELTHDALVEGSHLAYLKVESTTDTDPKKLDDTDSFPDYWPVKVPKTLYWSLSRYRMTSLPDTKSTFFITRCSPETLSWEEKSRNCDKNVKVAKFVSGSSELEFMTGESFDVKLSASSFEGNALNSQDVSEYFDISV